MSAGNVKLHRSLGTWGIAHGTVGVADGLVDPVDRQPAGMDAGRDPGTDGLYLGILAAIGFAIMFTLSIRNTRRPEVHKRMILFAMLPVLPPGVNRFWAERAGPRRPDPDLLALPHAMVDGGGDPAAGTARDRADQPLFAVRRGVDFGEGWCTRRWSAREWFDEFAEGRARAGPLLR